MGLALPLPDPNDPTLPGPPPLQAAPAAPAPTDPMQDPRFRAYIAKQAEAQAELRAAQQEASSSRDSLGMRVGNALLTFAGHPEQVNARYEQAGQPVRDVLARQDTGRAGTKGAQEETALSGEMFKSGIAQQSQDPNSPISRRVQSFWKPVLGDQAQYLTAADVAEAEKAGTLNVQTLHYRAQERQAAAQRAIEQGRLTEETRHHKVEESYMGQKDLPPAAVTELESKLDAVKALDDLKAQKAKSGTLDKILSAVGLGDFEQTKNAVSAEVAKADAKGRANPTGAIREKQLLPGAFQNDTGIDQKRKQYISEAERHLAVLKAGRVRPGQVEEYQKQIDALKAGSAPGGGSSAPTHYLISPDGKRRVPADASGKPLGPEEANPGG